MARRPGEVFTAFLRLGLTSFGGPIAHLGYFRSEFVDRRRWLSDGDFGQLLAICQFLPGPASSQLGFGIGLTQAGWAGALAAFVAFTLPSVLVLVAFAAVLPYIQLELAVAIKDGLKLVALVVVAHGLVGMMRTLTPDVTRVAIAAAAIAIILFTGTAWFQLVAIALGGAAGLLLCRDVGSLAGTSIATRYGTRTGIALLVVFTLLLVAAIATPALPVPGTHNLSVPGTHNLSGTATLSGTYNRLVPGTGDGAYNLLDVSAASYRAGALVFGGGHVVLPLLEESFVETGLVSQDDFLAGYGAAQAVPGPMFSLAAWLGGYAGGAKGATLALLAIFLPGFLLLAGILPLWQRLAQHASAARVIAGVNAAVVGLLAAALYDPVFTSAVAGLADIAIALAGFFVLLRWNVSALWIVLWCVTASVILHFIR